MVASPEAGPLAPVSPAVREWFAATFEAPTEEQGEGWAAISAGRHTLVDAPTGSGFWHWTVFNIPATVTELPAGAGSPDGANLPSGAVQSRNDANTLGYVGAGPPPGHGPHRYVFAVHALDVEKLGADANATPAFVGFSMFGHTLGRALLTATFER